MPQIDLIQNVLYEATYPYHWIYDNLPLENIIRRIDVVNIATDVNTRDINSARGSAPSLGGRLSQSLDDNGELKQLAVDQALHNVSQHTDDAVNLEVDELSQLGTDTGNTLSNPVEFVRMLSVERAKLALIAEEATSLKLAVETPSATPLFDNYTVTFKDSDSIEWVVSGADITGNIKYPDMTRRFYDKEPESADFLNYITPAGVSYKTLTLRVYINGARLVQGTEIYVPPSVPTGDWKLLTFSETDPASGTFALSQAIEEDDVIAIDFEQELS
jgi:hypothetical protein